MISPARGFLGSQDIRFFFPDRKPLIHIKMINDLRGIFAVVCADLEADLMEFDGEQDDACLLINYLPKLALSILTNSLKRVSSRMIRKKALSLCPRKTMGRVLWLSSCFSGSCSGALIAIILEYIEQQQSPE
ncbi:MAG TPA: IS200/IS605 family transposase [Ferrovaceae bacterium]|nr:IS200/IS605 family transposase [Ferrovaceae bacterium]HQU05865.1 IS200/IS605 family transposase [Ferrovaceae bacterium]